MRSMESAGPWVVYRMPVRGTDGGNVALCSQREWDEMDRAQPGRFTLIQAGITNEGEAERLARSNNPVPPPRQSSAAKTPGAPIPVSPIPDGIL
jgi:hypothetical protein